MAIPTSFRWDEDFIARIDAARGDVPRSMFVRRAVERALLEIAEGRSTAPFLGRPPQGAEGVRSSAQAKRDVRPVLKGA